MVEGFTQETLYVSIRHVQWRGELQCRRSGPEFVEMTILGSGEFLPKASYAHTADQINLQLACDTWLILCNDVDFGEHPTRLCIHTQTRLGPRKSQSTTEGRDFWGVKLLSSWTTTASSPQATYFHRVESLLRFERLVNCFFELAVNENLR